MTMQRDETITANRFFDSIKNSENNNTNADRSRVTSFSSFFSTSAIDGNESRSIFGFRKFAKACLMGSGKSSKRSCSRMMAEHNAINLSCLQDNSIVNGTDDITYAIPGEKMCYLHYQRQLEKNGTEIFAKTRRAKETHDYQLDSYGVPQRVPDLYKEENLLDLKESLISTSCSTEGDLCEEKFKQRSVILFDVPQCTGLGSILSQVCGGPLEMIMPHRNEIDRTLVTVELDFLTRDGAVSFMKYGKTNLFKVNGLHLVPEWKKLSELQPPALSEEYMEDIPEVCRCLILKRYASGTKKYKHGEHSREPVLDNLDVAEIRRDFQIFGEIQDITPIVSRKLCISISFYSVHNAIRAMDEYENPSSHLYKKYFKTWAIWYGKDITDRPCVEV